MNRRGVLLALAAAGATQSCSRQAELARTGGPLVLAAGESQGLATTLARLAWPDFGPVRLLATTGSVDSLRALEDGTATLALASADATAATYAGTPPSGTPPSGRAGPVRALARLHDDRLHLVTPAGTGPGTVAELRGARVGVGPAGSDTSLVADRLLDATGIDPRTGIRRVELDLTGTVEGLRQAELDAFFWSGPLPTPAITELAGWRGLRLLDLTEPAVRLRRLFGTCYRSGTIPTDTYPGQPYPVPTLTVPLLLVSTDQVPADRVRRLVSGIFRHADQIAADLPSSSRLDPGAAPFTEPIPLHPGALDYYRASKVG